MFSSWLPISDKEEILALSADEFQGAADILDTDPRTLSPLQLHWWYREADAISDTVGALIHEHDARRCRPPDDGGGRGHHLMGAARAKRTRR
jgi:hypothetical protein